MPRKKAKVDDEHEDSSEDIEEKKPAKKAQPRKRAPKRKEKVEDGEADAAEAVETPAAKPKKAAKRAPKASPNGPTSQEPYTAMDGWEVIPPSILHKSTCSELGKKVAAFDLDDTLVTVKSGLQFPRTAEDYKFFNKTVIQTVQQYHEDGYKIVIFSNQGGIKSALEGAMATKLKARAQLIIEELGCPITVFYATKDDEYRKPNRGMWDLFLRLYNQNQTPDMKKSFFVGDAAGRPGDHADTDSGFAEAVGLPFKLPEDVFGDAAFKKAAPTGQGDAGHNADLVQAFTKLAEVAGGSGDSSANFKAAALKKVAGVLSGWPAKVTCGKDVASVAGVGKASVQKIDEFLSTGKLQALEDANVKLDPVAASDKGAGAAFQFA